MEWQAIEMAPQDGKTKLILGAWDEHSDASTVTILALEPIDSDQGDPTKPRAIFGMGAIFYPTHWMPIPRRPAHSRSNLSVSVPTHTDQP